jgi:hypothetical protein
MKTANPTNSTNKTTNCVNPSVPLYSNNVRNGLDAGLHIAIDPEPKNE